MSSSGCFQNGVALFHDESPICSDIRPFLDETARPAYFESVGLLGGAEPEVEAEVIGGIETAATHYFVNLPVTAGDDGYSCTDRAPIRFGTN